MDRGLTYRGIHSSEKGLRIANISGRDILPDIESRTSQTASKHGLHYFGYRFNERRIRVRIALYGSSLSNFRSQLRDLAGWLNPHDGPGVLILDDEPDKKYYAVITDNTDFEGLFIKRVAEIEFLCPDPFAYAIAETSATITANSLTIDNDGTAETFPVIEITADGTAGPDNFAGKVSGETLDNPHVYGRRTNSALGDPTVSGNWYEPPTVNYNNISLLNNSSDVTGFTGSNVISQHKFSFNLIALIKRKFGFSVPGANLAEQVQWIKTNISQITANWWGKGTNKMSSPNGKVNFSGKVPGSLTANPNIAKRGAQSTLATPSSGLVELSQSEYDKLFTLDGQTQGSGGAPTTSGNIGQMLFSFNLIEYIKRKYGYTPTAQWLKDNISRLVMWHYGNGTGPNGNKLNLTMWREDQAAWYNSPVSHTQGNITQLGLSTNFANIFVDSKGFFHALAYADASNGTAASAVYTDFVELDIELKPGADKSSLTIWNPLTSNWSTTVAHTNTVISKLSIPTSSGNFIDSSGFVHFLAHADASNGIVASTIETDYIELQLTLSKIEGIKISYGSEFVAIQRRLATGDKVKIDNERGTITLNGTTDIISSLDIDSDFFAIKSGSSTLTVGGGNGTVRYTKRWL